MEIVVIEFLCPNGHRIQCPDEQAGRAAKCPQCGVKFRIPALEEIRAAEAAASEPQPNTSSDAETSDTATANPAPEAKAAAKPQSQAQPTPPPSGEPKDKDEHQIEFLCPNGHRLHGPGTSQGQPGQCPECGQKFYIPSFNDVPDDVETEQELTVSPQRQYEIVENEPATSRGDGEHPLCELMSKLWAQRPSGASVEVHLSNGETFVPDRFAKDLSLHQYALFAIKEPGGTHTLTLVSWDSIVRVEVRGAESLPIEMIG